MSKAFARAFYNSTAWKECREAYKHKAAYLCERCGAAGVIVHHKNYITPENITDPSILLNFDNLELLCRACHDKEHGEPLKKAHQRRKKKEGARFTIDNFGRVRATEAPPGAR